MPKRTDFSFILIIGAAMLAPASAYAQAPDMGWKVAPGKTSPAVMSRTLENLTVRYSARPGDADFLRVTVKPCDDDAKGWVEDDDVTPVGDSPKEKQDSVYDAIADSVQNGGLACTLSEGLEDRIMEGFGAAYVQYKAMKK